MSVSANNEGLRIEALDFHPERDLMLVILTNKTVLSKRLSDYVSLKTADVEQLRQYELIGGGTGVRWALFDEDLSLKGFLQGSATIDIGQYNAEVDEAMKRMDAGEFYTHNQVKEMAKGWLNDK
jgi:Protein of unknown function (DUF2442)